MLCKNSFKVQFVNIVLVNSKITSIVFRNNDYLCTELILVTSVIGNYT